MSCTDLQQYVDDLLNSKDQEEVKRGNMISEWVGKYVRLLKNENKKVTAFRYERGSVIKVNFGFRIGSELGGVHYCVVVNCTDNANSNTLVVVPMSSYKGKGDGEDTRISQVYIGSELKDTLRKHMAEESSLLTTEIADLNRQLPEAMANEEKLQRRLNRVMGEYSELGYMKDKSVILVDQIVTISKHRVIYPRNSYDVMSKVKLSPDTLDRLNDKIIEMIIGERANTGKKSLDLIS